MTNVQPFTLSVPQSSVDDLKARLALTRLPDELAFADWHYGVPLADVRRLTSYWADGYDWRAAEASINTTLPQFTMDISVERFGSLNVHFVHKQSKVEGAIPLLFVHGWPGSFLEVAKVLGPLTQANPVHPSFHVVAPSLPNFGFSEASKERGFRIHQYAEVCHKLMLSLGYEEYVCQGGDWGYIICRKLASLYGPTHVKAWHTNGPRGEPPRFFQSPLAAVKHAVTPYTATEQTGLKRLEWFMHWGRGYANEHSTRPQTLGYALADSPVGLLAWIYEKLVEWTDSYPWTDDEVLTWVSIYWHSRAGPAASLRIYYEAYQSGDNVLTLPVRDVPMGMSFFPKEIFPFPPSWTRHAFKVVFERRHAKGGHFAAHEAPEAVVRDVRDMFCKGGPVYGIVKGKNGYADANREMLKAKL